MLSSMWLHIGPMRTSLSEKHNQIDSSFGFLARSQARSLSLPLSGHTFIPFRAILLCDLRVGLAPKLPVCHSGRLQSARPKNRSRSNASAVFFCPKVARRTPLRRARVNQLARASGRHNQTKSSQVCASRLQRIEQESNYLQAQSKKAHCATPSASFIHIRLLC